jgi:hypothetical protein
MHEHVTVPFNVSSLARQIQGCSPCKARNVRLASPVFVEDSKRPLQSLHSHDRTKDHKRAQGSSVQGVSVNGISDSIQALRPESGHQHHVVRYKPEKHEAVGLFPSI